MLESQMTSSPHTGATTQTPVLEAAHLYKHFPVKSKGLLRKGPTPVLHAVDDANFRVHRGEFVALVGESGSGKTTLANCLAGLHAPTAGTINFEGKPVISSGPIEKPHAPKRTISKAAYARDVQMVYQDPYSALNPRMTVGEAVAEPLITHRLEERRSAQKAVRELFDLVKIPSGFERRYPHELNSGQRQRVVIARALSLRPQVLVADEPVAKLDVSMQGQVLNLLLDLQSDLGMTTVFITHDLSVVRQVATRVAVMYLGRLVEEATADRFFSDPVHPYSAALLASTPGQNAGASQEIFTIAGEVPSPINLPSGCRFETRCPVSLPECNAEDPPLVPIRSDSTHVSACIRRDDPGWRTQFLRPINIETEDEQE